MSKQMTKTRTRSELVNDFFFTTKVGLTLMTSGIMLFVGVIPAILISMAP